MSQVTEAHRAVGAWEIVFRGLPQALTDQLVELGHIAVTAAREDLPGDALLGSARYVGVLRGLRAGPDDDTVTARGAGMAWWLGTEDKAGAVYETPQTFSAATTFPNTIRALLPNSPTGAVREGTLHTLTGTNTYTGTHQWQSPREAIDFVCDRLDAEWRVNGTGLLDAGTQAQLFVSTPRALIARRVGGEDMAVRAFPGAAQLDRDVEDYVTRVVLLGQLEGADVVTGTAETSSGLIPYRDLFGGVVDLARVVSESSTDNANAPARAAAHLARLSRPRRAVTLDTGDHDFRGDMAVGDMVWVWDPEAGLVDPANEVIHQGQRLNPVREQVIRMTWPIRPGMGVYYRDRDGAWIDLSDWVQTSAGDTSVEVGPRSSALDGGAQSPTGRIPEPDTSVPGVPTFVTPFPQAVYLNAESGRARAQVQVQWTGPASNTDATPFVDGSHFEVRYRPSSSPMYPALWAQAAAGTWGGLGTWGQPVTQSVSDWSVAFAGADQTSVLVQELEPGAPYEYQVRALDSASPPNAGAWSATYVQYTAVDVEAPGTPAAPVVAGSKIAIQVVHYLGADTGGTFNLALDLAYLEVHRGTTSGFTPERGPDSTTKLGRIVATQALIRGRIPAVGSFPVDTTQPIWVKVVAVDQAGNASGPSAAAQVSAELIDAQWITSVFAETIVSGTVLANLIVGGEIATGSSGQRARMTFAGFEAFMADGVTRFFHVDVPGQTMTMVGTYRSGLAGARIEQLPDGTARYYQSTGSNFSEISNDGLTGLRFRGPAANNSTNVGYLYVAGDNCTIAWGAQTLPSGSTPRLRADSVGVQMFGGLVGIRRLNTNPTGTIFFAAQNASNVDINASVLHYRYQSSTNNAPLWGAPGQDAGFVFGGSQVFVTDGDGNTGSSRSIVASAFTPSSALAGKVNVRPLLDAGRAADLVRAVSPKRWQRRAELAPRPERPGFRVRAEVVDPVTGERREEWRDGEWATPPLPARTYVGLVADDLVDAGLHDLVVDTTGRTEDRAIDLNGVASYAWAAAAEAAEDCDRLAARVAALEAALAALGRGGPP